MQRNGVLKGNIVCAKNIKKWQMAFATTEHLA